MLIRISYTDTVSAIEEVIDKLYTDTEVHELLHLLVLSCFCMEADYRYSSINKKIQNKLKLLDIQESELEDIYNVLYT